MLVPFMSSPTERQSLYRRKGGGGGKGSSSGGKSSGSSSSESGSSSSKGGGSSSGGSGSSSKGKTSSVPIAGATSGRSTATSYGAGGGKAIIIPSGQPFAGRSSGGGTRSQVYGTSAYGSGYPGVSGLGVGGRSFPFVFWPVVYGSGFGYGASYLHDSEYGEPNNASRPGGPMAEATFTSPSSNSTFHLLADNSTVASLITAVAANCTLGASSPTAPAPYDATAGEPVPEQAVQYFRASTVVLTLDGYNNTVALTGAANASAVPLPGWTDQTLLGCLNDTIGEAVPLISGADARWRSPCLGTRTLALLWMMWCLKFLAL